MKRKGMFLLKSLAVAYMFTMILLLLLAFGLYKFDLSEKVVQGGIVGTYIISTFVGGLVIGKLSQTKRFLWGLACGGGYCMVLFLISLLIYHSSIWGQEMLLAISLCIGGGMVGAMIS